LSEASRVSSAQVQGDVTTLSLDAPLARLYDTPTVRVNANAVDASHGETVQELLGSGDATQAALTFTLKQTPLTYVSSTSPGGVESTLQVWVNNLRWHEMPNLLAAGRADRVFVTRVDQSGPTVIQFGDGVNGARPPTGQMNIRAVYRKGIGSAGMLAEGQLSQALDRPQGLRTALNPGVTAGGADPAGADDARARAPLPTLTIGRVVSLEDYQNYALNFGGIAKAAASWICFNGTRGVFLTIAGAAGAAFRADDDVVLNLVASLRKYGDPHVRLQVASYDAVPFQIAASVRVDGDRDSARVMTDAWNALAARFAFERRLLGQNVAASEVIETVQNTPGVLAVQLGALFATGEPGSGVPVQLCASGARPPRGVQLLVLDPACRHAFGVWS
jgi:predicted phage baseplate assembly protein